MERKGTKISWVKRGCSDLCAEGRAAMGCLCNQSRQPATGVRLRPVLRDVTWDQATRSSSAPPIACGWEWAFQLGSKASTHWIFSGKGWASLGIAFSVFCSPSFSAPALSGLWPW